jgi:hypothetical protein
MFDHAVTIHSDATSTGGLTLAGAAQVTPITPTLPASPGGSFVSYDGATISGTISGITAHNWIDDAQGLFQTTTDLQTEWSDYYAKMIAGQGSQLTPTERLEGQAQALFLFTGLGTLSVSAQAMVREDVQREIDVIGWGLSQDQVKFGTDPNAPLTALSYLQLGNTIMGNAQMEELGVQGHGLNNPPLPRYNGYTNDAQHTADKTTLYLGYGADHNEKAVTNFMDDAIMTHLVFPVVMKQGKLVQLNQDGDREESLVQAVNAIDRTMYGTALVASNFSTPKNAAAPA